MAIAFARAEYKSRAKGGRATRSAAYNERDVLADERTGERYDFRSHRQPGDIALGVLLPNGAPVRFAEPVALWNAAETAEKRKDAQVAREVVIALPKEGGVADWTVLATRFAEKHFVSKGVAVQVDIHAPDAETPNPHAHFLITTRRLTATGFEAKKARDLDPEVATAKGRAFVSDGERWGELWRQEQDEYFREQGLSLRVDPTQAKPERHLGPKRHRAPEDSAPKVDAARTELENAAAWRDPAAILEVMTRSSATFRLRELDRQLNSRIADAGERASVRASVLAHRDLVPLHDRQTGQATGRLTTRQVQQEERQVLADAAGLAADQQHRPRPAAVGAAIASRTLRADQLDAFHHVLNAGGLAVLQGRAGTGKSYTLATLAEAYQRSGYEVLGLAPTNAVGRELAADPQVSRGGTLHSELWHVEQGKRQWSEKTVILVDEAGMVDSKTMGRLTAAARSAGAKVILVGDDRQLQSVSRGGLFRELVAEHGAAEIVTVTRQRVAWQRQAAEDLAGGRAREALTAFDREGAIRWSDTQDDALSALVDQWAADSLERPQATRFVLAYTNADVHELNARLRAIRAERGEIGHDVLLTSEGEQRAFAVQDRVQLIRTDKKRGLFNGEAGVIEHIQGNVVQVRLDSGQRVSWDSREFEGFRLGYAGTVYKSQGRTLDATYLLHSRQWRQESTYVALTRQRDSAQVFVARETAADLEELVRQVSRSDDRRAAMAYCSPAEAALVRRAWEAVEGKIREARTFAARAVGGARESAEVAQSRPPGDRLGAYLQARAEAGACWAEIEVAGCALEPRRHPAYPAFAVAQERRNRAVRAVAVDPVALAALQRSGVVSPLEFSADHLMATGTLSREEARERAAAHAIELGLAESRFQPERQREREHAPERGHGFSL